MGNFFFFKISFISPYSFKKRRNLKIFLPLDMLSSIDLALTTERTFFSLIRHDNIRLLYERSELI
jgi:hypothetical protein